MPLDNDTPFDALVLFPKDYITPFSCCPRRQATTVTQNNGTTLTRIRGGRVEICGDLTGIIGETGRHASTFLL